MESNKEKLIKASLKLIKLIGLPTSNVRFIDDCIVRVVFTNPDGNYNLFFRDIRIFENKCVLSYCSTAGDNDLINDFNKKDDDFHDSVSHTMKLCVETQIKTQELKDKYFRYVAYANKINKKPVSYLDWICLVKNEFKHGKN